MKFNTDLTKLNARDARRGSGLNQIMFEVRSKRLTDAALLTTGKANSQRATEGKRMTQHAVNTLVATDLCRF